MYYERNKRERWLLYIYRLTFLLVSKRKTFLIPSFLIYKILIYINFLPRLLHFGKQIIMIIPWNYYKNGRSNITLIRMKRERVSTIISKIFVLYAYEMYIYTQDSFVHSFNACNFNVLRIFHLHHLCIISKSD